MNQLPLRYRLPISLDTHRLRLWGSYKRKRRARRATKQAVRPTSFCNSAPRPNTISSPPVWMRRDRKGLEPAKTQQRQARQKKARWMRVRQTEVASLQPQRRRPSRQRRAADMRTQARPSRTPTTRTRKTGTTQLWTWSPRSRRASRACRGRTQMHMLIWTSSHLPSSLQVRASTLKGIRSVFVTLNTASSAWP